MKSILEQKQKTEFLQSQRIQSLERELITHRRELTNLRQLSSEAEPLKNKCALLRQLREQMEGLNAVSIEFNRLQSQSVRLSGTIKNTEKQLSFEHNQLTAMKNGIDQKTAELERLTERQEQLTVEMESISGQITGIEQQEKQRDQLREEEVHLKTDCKTLISSGNEIKEKTAYLEEHQGGICPTCGQEVRVPKGKGHIRITCPKCKGQFDRSV